MKVGLPALRAADPGGAVLRPGFHRPAPLSFTRALHTAGLLSAARRSPCFSWCHGLHPPGYVGHTGSLRRSLPHTRSWR